MQLSSLVSLWVIVVALATTTCVDAISPRLQRVHSSAVLQQGPNGPVAVSRGPTLALGTQKTLVSTPPTLVTNRPSSSSSSSSSLSSSSFSSSTPSQTSKLNQATPATGKWQWDLTKRTTTEEGNPSLLAAEDAKYESEWDSMLASYGRSFPMRSLVEGESGIMTSVDATVKAYPNFPFTLPLGTVRAQVRGGTTDAQAWAADAHLNAFGYYLDAYGRVERAIGTVNLKTRTTLSQNVHQYCDAVYQPGGPYQGGRPRLTYHSGHIIASALGGTDLDPLNFFPQHRGSNSGGGKWWRIELIAGAVAGWFLNQGLSVNCPVTIQPILVYNDVTNPLTGVTTVRTMPGSGTYTISVSNACFLAFSGPGLGGHNAYARPFLRAALDLTTGNRYIRTNWQNAPDPATLVTAPELF